MLTQRIWTSDWSRGYRLPIVFRITYIRTFIYSNWILIWVSINATHVGGVVRNYRYRVFECSSECRASRRKKILGCRWFAIINVMFSVLESRYITDLRHEPYESATRVDADRISLTRTKVGHCIQFSGSEQSGNISLRSSPIYLYRETGEIEKDIPSSPSFLSIRSILFFSFILSITSLLSLF